MSDKVRAMVVRLADAGFSAEAISRTASLPVYDIRRVIG